MVVCPSCGADVPTEATYCVKCGAEFAASSEDITRVPGVVVAPPAAGRRAVATATSTRMSASASAERFAPGTVLGGRFRLEGRVGRGGMGEVYRAHDLTLDQTVALKFLPAEVGADAARLERLRGEVRIARRVSHPNVCRVYDIGEADGHHYLSMEFIDGENLASLLRRIGRLPGDKALEIARQLCAGLAAAHDQGVLHRDLKPANVMIDGLGRVRITDFGLAAAAMEIRGPEARAGTPGYMAPEQLAGREANARSDIFSLGLVMYELFTGRRAYRAETVQDLRDLHARAAAQPPSEIVPDIDPAVEAAIMRCLEVEPAARPASARAVAAALPGGDPLAAALEAGETPSPALVASAGTSGRLRPRVAVGAVVLLLVSMASIVLLSRSTYMVSRVPLKSPPDVLASKAEEIVRSLGYTEAPGDRAYDFDLYDQYLEEIQRKDKSVDRWGRLSKPRPAAIDFWYRQGPRPIVARAQGGRVTFDDPPMNTPGMINVRLDPTGRLRELNVLTGRTVETRGGVPAPLAPAIDRFSPAEAPWDKAFAAAGLEMPKFRETEPVRVPQVHSERRRAWEGQYPESPELKIRVEGAALGGRIVDFRIIEKNWEAMSNFGDAEVSERGWVGRVLAQGVATVSFIGALFLAWHNWHHKRGDRTGALKVAIAMGAAAFWAWILRADHAPSAGAEAVLIADATSSGLAVGAWFWIFYMALEPYVRRVWPETVITWSRFLEGRLRDPRVGRDFLCGAALGAICGVIANLDWLSAGWVGRAPPPPMFNEMFTMDTLRGARPIFGVLFDIVVNGAGFSMAFVLALVLLKFLTRRRWVAAAGWAVIQTAIWALVFYSGPLSWVLEGMIAAICTITVVRLGIFPLMVGSVTFFIMISFPMTLDVRSWNAGSTYLGLAVVLAMGVYGAIVSTTGRAVEPVSSVV